MGAVNNIHTHLNLNSNEIRDVRLEHLESDPAAASGRLYYNRKTRDVRFSDGENWHSFGLGVWSIDDDGNIVASGNVIIDGNLIVKGDTASGGEGQDTPASGISGIRVNGTLYEDYDSDGIIDLGIISGGEVDLTDYVTKQELAAVATSGKYSDLSGLPTLGSLASKDSLAVTDIPDLSSKYLPLGGGTLKNITYSTVLRIDGASNALVDFLSAGTKIGSFGMTASGGLVTINADGSKTYNIIHDGNIGSYAIKKEYYFSLEEGLNVAGYGGTSSGWTQNGAAMILGYSSEYRWAIQAYGTQGTHRIVSRYCLGGTWSDWKTIAFTDSNVASATKLATARTIWGQSFDGTGNVSGALSGVTNINGAITINSSGNVGIGTTSPAYKLDVNGLAKATAFKGTNVSIECASDGTTSGYGGEINRFGGGQLYIQTRSGIGALNLGNASGGVKMYGAVTMSSSLNVKEGVTAHAQFLLYTTDDAYRLSMFEIDNIARLYNIDSAGNYYGDMYIGSNSTGAIVTLGGNYVGIGITPSKSYKFEVKGSSYFDGNITTKGNLVVSGDVASGGESGTTTGGTLDEDKLQKYLDDNSYITISSLSGYATETWVGNNYLPLNGGILSSTNVPLVINRKNGSYASIKYQHNDTDYGILGFDNFGEAVVSTKRHEGNTRYYTLIHSGNIGSQSVTSARKLVTSGGTNLVYSDSSSYFVAGLHDYSTYIDGKTIYLRYAASGIGMVMNTSGNVTIGGSDLASTNFKFCVDGESLFKERLRLASGKYLWMNQDAAGMFLSGTGMYWHDKSNAYTKSLMTFAEDKITLIQPVAMSSTLRVSGASTLAGVTSNSIVPSANNAYNLGNAGTRWGNVYANIVNTPTVDMASKSATLAATGWYKVATDNKKLTCSNVIIDVKRVYNATNNETYTFLINCSYNGKTTITQIGGSANTQIITKIAVYNPTSPYEREIYIYYNSSSGNTVHIDCIGDFTAIAPTEATPPETLVTTMTIGTGGFRTSSNLIVNDVLTARGGEHRFIATGGETNPYALRFVANSTATYIQAGKFDGSSNSGTMILSGYNGSNLTELQVKGPASMSSTLSVTTSVTTPLLKSSGGLDIVANNSGAGSRLWLTTNVFRPWGDDNGLIDLGASNIRWKGLYCGTGNFSGAVTMSSTLSVASSLTLSNNLTLSYASTALKVETPNGASFFGAMNDSNCHIYTDLPAFYMNKGLSASNLTSRGTLTVAGVATMSSTLSVKSISITDTTAAAHLAFGRGNANYITAPASGSLSFVTNGKACSLSTSDLQIRDAEVKVNGNLIITGDTANGSDIRFKDIIEHKILSIADIANAPCFTFKWNDREDDKLHLGTSAQYWEALAPELVSGSDFKTLNYASLGVAMGISLAKKAMNHEERIKQLEKQVETLKEENRRLRNGNVC